MAGWRDQLRPASFRGVGFEARSRTMKGGRRIAEHVFPQRDESYPEDLGRKNRGYSIDAFLFGADYMKARDELLKALEDKGPGEYIDLWGFTHQVVCRDFTVAENIAEGGYVSFAIDFLEYSLQPLHTVKADTGFAVRQAADGANAALVEDFGQSFSVRGNDSLLTDATSMVDALLGDFDQAMAKPSATFSTAEGGVSAVTGRIGQFRGGLTSLMGMPGSLGSRVSGLLSSVLGLSGTGWPRYRTARGFSSYGGSLAPVLGTTPTRAQAAANQVAMVNLVRGLALTEAARASADIPFAVYDDAIDVRQELATDIDGQMATASDPVYRALGSLRTAVIRDITTRGADLSRLADVEPGATMPALVLAQQLYGDAGREADVLARNPQIRHPGFVPGGVKLKVPVDG